MGTTSNYSWPYPESTGLVKDGWEDIKDLATAIDTTAAASFGGGLKLLNTTSFSAVASQSFSNFTSASYTHYKVVWTLVGSTNMLINFKFRENVTDKSTGYYGAALYYRSNNTSGLTGVKSNASEATLGSTGSGVNYAAGQFTMSKPDTERSIIHGQSWDSQSLGGQTFAYVSGSATDITGFSIIASTGTITGKVTIYGLSE